MVLPIDKERNQRVLRKYYIIIGSIVYIFGFLTLLHYKAIRLTEKRASFEEVLNQAMLNIILKPFEILEVDFRFVLYVVLGSIMAAFILIMIISERALKKHDNPDTVNGEAHLMNEKELMDYNMKMTDPLNKPDNTGPNNMILSKDIRLAIDGYHTRRNCNILIIGGSGAGKTRFFAAPNILQHNSNLVITDPSGELVNDYGKDLEDAGYTVKIFNLVDVFRSNQYNPFHYIKEEKDVFILVNTLIKNTTPSEGHSGDPFWEKSENLLISALILYLWHTREEKDQTFSKVLELLNQAEVDENNPTSESPLDILFNQLEEIEPENLAVKQYKKFKQGAGKTLKSILISVGVRLQAFDLSDIKYLTSKDNFNFESFADTKQALFVIIPTADSTFNFLVSLLYTQLFSSLYTYVETRASFGWEAYIDNLNIIKVVQAESKKESKNAKRLIEEFVEDVKAGVKANYNKEKKIYEIRTKKTNTLVTWRGKKEDTIQVMKNLANIKIQKCPRKCPNHVRLILDEFANIGQIPEFDQKLSTIRKYEISCSIILQAISQLKEIYDKKWNTIAANCDTKLFLGCDDTDTIKWLIEMLGKKTTIVENMSFQGNGNGSTSYNRSSIELLTIDQLTMMQDDECLVRVRGMRPHYGKKYELTIHPNYKYANSKAGEFEIPVAKDMEIYKRSGPLRNRMKKPSTETTTAASVAENSVQKNHIPSQNPNVAVNSDFDKNMMKAKNAAKKKEAKTAKETVSKMDNHPIEVSEEMIAEGLANAFGCTPEMTDAQIKDAVESKLILDTPPSESFIYAMTN